MRLAGMTFAALLAATPSFAQSVENNTHVNATSGSTATTQASGNSINSYSNNPRQAPTAIAPGLAAAGIESCLGSASAGISGGGFGISLGGTHEDPGCDIRLTARQLAAMGYRPAAIAVMCQSDRVARAMAITGTPCPGYPGYTESLTPGSSMARAAVLAPALGYGNEPPRVATQTGDYFVDSKGRRYETVSVEYRSDAEARRHGAKRSASGEWVRLVK